MEFADYFWPALGLIACAIVVWKKPGPTGAVDDSGPEV